MPSVLDHRPLAFAGPSSARPKVRGLNSLRRAAKPPPARLTYRRALHMAHDVTPALESNIHTSPLWRMAAVKSPFSFFCQLC